MISFLELKTEYNERVRPVWFDSGLCSMLRAKSSNPAVRMSNLAEVQFDKEQKSSFLVYETDLPRSALEDSVELSLIETMLQAI